MTETVIIQSSSYFSKNKLFVYSSPNPLNCRHSRLTHLMINKPQLIAKGTFPSKLYLFYKIFKVQNMHFISNHSESSFCESFPICCLPNIFPNRHNNSLIVLVPAFENQLAACFSGYQNIKYKYIFNDRLLAPPPTFARLSSRIILGCTNHSKSSCRLFSRWSLFQKNRTITVWQSSRVVFTPLSKPRKSIKYTRIAAILTENPGQKQEK